MIVKLANNAAQYFADKKIYTCKEVNIYKYGFELLISTILNGFGILLMSALLGIIFEAVLFVAAFVPIRITAGGYHAKHHWSCIFGFNIVFLFFTIFLKFLDINYILLYSLIAVMISSLIIWVFSPVEADNKPMGESQKNRMRKQSIVISNINLGMTLVFLLRPNPLMTMFAFYLSGALAASLSLVVAVTVNTTEKGCNQL